ncbi:MAG: hypothetical protein ACKVT2_14400 [Saprospiraceae bacterium]
MANQEKDPELGLRSQPPQPHTDGKGPITLDGNFYLAGYNGPTFVGYLREATGGWSGYAEVDPDPSVAALMSIYQNGGLDYWYNVNTGDWLTYQSAAASPMYFTEYKTQARSWVLQPDGKLHSNGNGNNAALYKPDGPWLYANNEYYQLTWKKVPA